jgi:hypothetical protein
MPKFRHTFGPNTHLVKHPLQLCPALCRLHQPLIGRKPTSHGQRSDPISRPSVPVTQATHLRRSHHPHFGCRHDHRCLPADRCQKSSPEPAGDPADRAGDRQRRGPLRIDRRLHGADRRAHRPLAARQVHGARCDDRRRDLVGQQQGDVTGSVRRALCRLPGARQKPRTLRPGPARRGRSAP